MAWAPGRSCIRWFEAFEGPETEQVPHLRWSQAPPLPWRRPGSADMASARRMKHDETWKPKLAKWSEVNNLNGFEPKLLIVVYSSHGLITMDHAISWLVLTDHVAASASRLDLPYSSRWEVKSLNTPKTGWCLDGSRFQWPVHVFPYLSQHVLPMTSSCRTVWLGGSTPDDVPWRSTRGLGPGCGDIPQVNWKNISLVAICI